MSRHFTGKQSVGTRKITRPNGDVYVYERTTQYDQKTKKTVTLHNRLLGKIDAKTGELVPTRPKKKKKSDNEMTQRLHLGATEILDWVGKNSGIDQDLATAFDEGSAQKLSTIARYWLATDGATLPRLEAWQVMHPTPYRDGMSEDVYGKLFASVGIDENGIQTYFALRAARLNKSATIAFDSTTISTYSENQTQARQGFNKDRDGLDTIKLLTLYSVKDKEPIAFAKQPGNVPDVISIENALKQLKCFNLDRPTVVTDNGYYSQGNMTEFARRNIKFLTLASSSVNWIRQEIDAAREDLGTMQAVCTIDHKIRCAIRMLMHEFSFTRERSRGEVKAGDTEQFQRRLYVHVYFSQENVAKDEANLTERLLELKRQVEQGETFTEAGKKRVEKFITTSRVGRGGKLHVSFNNEAYQEAKKYFGFFVLISNEIKDANKALEQYRLREKIEELFAVQKNSMDGRRPRNWYPDALLGRQFAQFVGLGYHCFLTKKIKEVHACLGTNAKDKTKEQVDLELNLKRWIEARSLIQILDWFDCIEQTTVKTPKGCVRWSTESVKRDELFLTLLGVRQ